MEGASLTLRPTLGFRKPLRQLCYLNLTLPDSSINGKKLRDKGVASNQKIFTLSLNGFMCRFVSQRASLMRNSSSQRDISMFNSGMEANAPKYIRYGGVIDNFRYSEMGFKNPEIHE